MNKQVSLAFTLVFLIATGVLANSPAQAKKSLRQIDIVMGFTKIVINGNADVVLTTVALATATIEGEEATVNGTTLVNENGVSTIKAGSSKSHGKPVIKIPVHLLEQLFINGDCTVASTYFIPAENLVVFINGVPAKLP